MPYARASHPGYTQHPLVHRDRRLSQGESDWERSFSCEDMGILIVGRGPIRKEAIDVMREMGIERVGMLLSERDSIVYPRSLAPEVRLLPPEHVHPIPDYTGATREAREACIDEIIAIARRHDYGYVFAGYGFMSEDPHFVERLEAAGVRFIGPSSSVQAAAGAKDAARRTAEAVDVSLTPGIDDLARRTLLARHPDAAALGALARKHGIEETTPSGDLAERADSLLTAARAASIDLVDLEEIAEQARREAEALLADRPGRRFRLKAIGGGGGKGQRVFERAEDVPDLVREVLAEVKATGPGDDKNLLIELNVEATRHLEIQMIGNGDWCVTLGGRDCSLQMHEQKLVEISLTRERISSEVARARSAGQLERMAALEREFEVLTRMEEEAARFGEAVGLNSASTFESIVSEEGHFFMEVNTRIQVEHRVSELCYGLRFVNPDEPTERFAVHSIVAAMVLIARHGDRLPKPELVEREGAAVEVRLNATDDALQPAAGGILDHWSDPVEHEIRDDQGISLKNPDTRSFMRYRLAGAYDSNIALLLSTGRDRDESWRRLVEVLRRTRLAGSELATNRAFLLGIMEWFRHRDAWAQPTTGFVRAYQVMVGGIAEQARLVDVDQAMGAIADQWRSKAEPALLPALAKLEARKTTLVRRPLSALLAAPHLLSAWLSRHRDDARVEGGRVQWLRNPLEILVDSYELLDLMHDDAPAAERIWDHDLELVTQARGFYRDLEELRPTEGSWAELDRWLREGPTPDTLSEESWHAVQGAHLGHQFGLEALGILVGVGDRADFEGLTIHPDLSVPLPAELSDGARAKRAHIALAPPPETPPDEIVAPMAGVLYNREAPDRPPFVGPGHHFAAGDTLFVIEVMKMFNRYVAPFAGTIVDVHVHENGSIVRKGQPVFRVVPDEETVIEDPEVVAARRREVTGILVECAVGGPSPQGVDGDAERTQPS